MAATGTGAALPLETADATGAVTVDEKVAVLAAHLVAQETASLNEQVETLKTENAALKTENASLKDKVEVAEVAKVTAEKAFADYKDEQAKAVERAQLADTRKAEVARVAPTLLEGEEARVAERVARWTAMDEAAFTDYVAELASVAGNTGQGAGTETFDASKGETALDRTRKASKSTKSAAHAVLGLNG